MFIIIQHALYKTRKIPARVTQGGVGYKTGFACLIGKYASLKTFVINF